MLLNTKISFYFKSLKEFFTNNDEETLLREYEKKSSLKDSSRREAVNLMVNSLRKNFGNYPAREEKIAVAKAGVTVFPSYKVENSEFGGIVRLTFFLNLCLILNTFISLA